MTLYRYRLTPESAVSTPLMSDTFFGHFCWEIRYREGEAALANFLDAFGGQGPAPVLFSSAFPADTLPRPALPPLPRKRVEAFAKAHNMNLLETYARFKKWKQRAYIPLTVWDDLKNGYSEESLAEAFFAEDPAGEEMARMQPTKEVRTGNVISRAFGTVEPGGLFTRETSWYAKGEVLDLYVEVNDPRRADFTHAFITEYLPASGFGADKSVGMGRFAGERIENFSETDLTAENANARLSLSLAAFDGIGDIPADYRLTTKFGKLGGHFAVFSPNGGPVNPFKKPILMYQPGAVFHTTDPLNTRPLLENIHIDPRIRHCGVPVVVPICLKEDRS